MLRSVLLSFIICVFAFTASAQKKQNQKKNAEILFIVGSSAVSAEEFIELYKKNHPDNKDYTKEAIGNYLDLFIKFKQKVQAARDLGLDTATAFINEFAGYKEELKRPYMADATLLDDLVKEAYDRYKTEINASHILISVNPEATPQDTLAAYQKISNIRARLASGEDFAVLAAQLSEDPSAKYNFGNLGWFTSMQMVYPFESAAYKTAKAELSEIVKTRFGYHLLKVHDIRPASGEVEVAHIMLRTGAGKDSLQVVNQIQDIYQKLLAGADWDELCSKYSDDANTKFNGGKFKAFGVGAFASVPEFETMAFSMYEPGTYSKPFTTAYGWHIIKLIDRISLPTYDQLAPTLRSRISRDERVAISKKQQIQKLLKQYSYTENEQVKNSMLLAADSSLNKASWRRQVVNSADYVATLADQKISLQDFYQYAEKNQQPNMMQPAAYMQQLYDGFLEKMVLDLEEQRLIRENKSFALLLKEYEEGLLLFDIMERMVWNRAVIDTTGLRAFHEVNRSNYNWNERVKASIFAHKDKNILQKIESIAANEKALMAYRDEHKISYVADAFEKGQSEVLDALTWTPGNYFYQLKDLHYYIQIHEILSPAEKSLEEARGELIADYQEYLENQWLNHLQQKYPLKLNEKVKKYVVSVLQQ